MRGTVLITSLARHWQSRIWAQIMFVRAHRLLLEDPVSLLIRELRLHIVWKYAFVGLSSTASPQLAEDAPKVLYWEFVTQALYNPVLSLVRSSVLVLLLRIGGHRTSVRRTIHVMNMLNLLFMVAVFLVVLFQSTPIQASWDIKTKAISQIDFGTFAVATACITIVGDIFVLAIPVWLFLGLQMRLSLKLGLIAAFLLSGM